MLLYGKNFAITAQPGVAAPLANVPKDYEARLVKLDFSVAADNLDSRWHGSRNAVWSLVCQHRGEFFRH